MFPGEYFVFKLHDLFANDINLFDSSSCPGFSWDKVNFHMKLIGLTQTNQSNGIFDTM